MNHDTKDIPDKAAEDRRRARETIDALVTEAYQRALDRGEAITNPDAWKAWKRGVYVEQAKREGAGYLRKHFERLGLGVIVAPRPTCPACGLNLFGEPVRHDGNAYCSYSCAGIETVTLREWVAQNPASPLAGLLKHPREETTE